MIIMICINIEFIGLDKILNSIQEVSTWHFYGGYEMYILWS